MFSSVSQMTQTSLDKCNMVDQGYQPGSCTVQEQSLSKRAEIVFG